MANEFNFDDEALYKEFDLGADFDQPDLPPNRVAAVGRALKDIIGEAAPAMGRAVKSKLSDELMDEILALNGSLAADAFGDLLFLRHWDSSNPILKARESPCR